MVDLAAVSPSNAVPSWTVHALCAGVLALPFVGARCKKHYGSCVSMCDAVTPWGTEVQACDLSHGLADHDVVFS